MLNKDSFRNPELWLEKHNKNKLVGKKQGTMPSIPDELWTSCPSCKGAILTKDLRGSLEVCTSCGYHFTLGARKRIEVTVDPDSFQEFDKELGSVNRISFPGYDGKLESAKAASGENEAVICGRCLIGGFETVLCVMESRFIMGSMGTAVGEKITRTIEYATSNSLPVVIFSVSGGARMHEGILSLMQMAKTSGAVKLHSDAGLLYLSVITNPTTGGVTASFAMEGDIIISEPGALIGFAGPRVIEQTIKQKLPAGFQSAEFLLEKGFLDAIVKRSELKTYIAGILRLHQK
ncbi:MAG: acetyl-CoA carboxylase, carboxyltransferase subunit beta [Saccharofermentanales bacterium]